MKAREHGIRFKGQTGKYNAITDVMGIEVGHSTIISGDGPLKVGMGPIRTGVTAILPRGKNILTPVFAAYHSLNGNGEMTGTHWIKESGFLGGPIMITNTHSVGAVHEATIRYMITKGMSDDSWSLPCVAETWDGYLNDINGFHIREENVFEALDNAQSGHVDEGNIGGGTGMICHEYKGGIGTSSRLVKIDKEEFVVGILVQANYGYRKHLRIEGINVGEIFSSSEQRSEQGSIIIILATDAPLLPHQLDRLVRRIPLGLSRVGGYGGNSSGDIFLAFSTANQNAYSEQEEQVRLFPNNKINPIFNAAVEATEEAIINALCQAETMIGRDDHTVIAMPVDEIIKFLRTK
ncbi:MAG: P1 family peptidase [Candidatus Heimdallarchaeota archaeon]|nr:P1 family peptidase [Candidatus Heimdallarchaeota archaeon]